MLQRNTMHIGITSGLLAAGFLLPIMLNVRSQTRSARPAWPKKEGVYIATSSETIPLFPRALTGYRSIRNKDYWNEPFASTGAIRVFEGTGWEIITDSINQPNRKDRSANFPLSMNHCSDGVFMIRWRSGNPNVRVASALGYHYSGVVSGTKTGRFGYMYGTNCEEPMFKFAGTLNGNRSGIVDIYYELKFWQAAP